MLLKEKTAVITGCLQGIGLATLDLFAQNGADIFACCQCETEEFIAHVLELEKNIRLRLHRSILIFQTKMQ